MNIIILIAKIYTKIAVVILGGSITSRPLIFFFGTEPLCVAMAVLHVSFQASVLGLMACMTTLSS